MQSLRERMLNCEGNCVLHRLWLVPIKLPLRFNTSMSFCRKPITILIGDGIVLSPFVNSLWMLKSALVIQPQRTSSANNHLAIADCAIAFSAAHCTIQNYFHWIERILKMCVQVKNHNWDYTIIQEVRKR